MKTIHLFLKDPDLLPWPTEKGSKTYESGYWSLTIDQAKQLKGKPIYFHKKKALPSFFGGKVLGHRIEEDDPWKDRIILIFKPEVECKGKMTGRDGWAMEMKVVE